MAAQSILAIPIKAQAIGGDGMLIWGVVLLVLVVFVVAGGWFVFGRRRSATKETEDVQRQTAEAKRRAATALVDVGRLLRDAREKSQYDHVSFDMDDAARLAETQHQLEEQYTALQQRFDETDENLSLQARPGIDDLEQAASTYHALREPLDTLRAELMQLASQRAELDDLAQQATRELSQSQRLLDDIAARGEPLHDVLPAADAIAAPVRRHLERAEQAQAANSPRGVREAVRSATALADTIIAMLERVTDLQAGIEQGMQDAETFAAQGYYMHNSRTHLARSQEALDDMLRWLQEGSEDALDRAEQSMHIAERSLEQAIATGRQLPELAATNEQRLATLETTTTNQIAAAIREGRSAFDEVDEFAESAWNDIRDNVQQAEAAAERAQQHMQQAREYSTMETQQFIEARAELDAANQEFEQADRLIEAIKERLTELKAARDTARAELAAAAEDIARGWEFVQARDPQVGEVPERQLREAEALLAEARAEMEKPRPDWLLLMKRAQTANAQADEALAEARSEVEIREKLRTEVQRARQVTASEVQRAERFLAAHIGVVSAEHKQAFRLLQVRARGNNGVLGQSVLADMSIDELQSLLAHYRQVGEQAEQVYADMYADSQ